MRQGYIDSQGNKYILTGIKAQFPKWTYAEWQAEGEPEIPWIWKDAPSGYRKVSGDDVSYDNTNSVNDILDLRHCNLIKKSLTNQTYVAQLTEIYNSFNTLTTEQKMRSFLKLGNGVYSIQNIKGVFTQSSVSGASVVIASFDTYNKTYQYIINNFTIVDGSSTISTNDMELYVIGDLK